MRLQINSQAQEQLFSRLKNKHFLNMMNPGNHLLLNRSLPNFRNIEKNELCLKDMEKRLKCKFYILDLGRLITYKRCNVERTETKQ